MIKQYIKIMVFILYFFIPSVLYTYSGESLEKIKLHIGENVYTGDVFYKLLESKLDKNYILQEQNNQDYYISYYKKLDKTLGNYINTHVLSKKRKLLLSQIQEIVKYGLLDHKIKKKYLESDTKNSPVKVLLGYSEEGREIYGYYKGNPKDGFFGIFANIHGGYEYGTYDTAMYIMNNFINSGKSGWFIIPTINPDGLQIAKNNNKSLSSYIEGRGNIHDVDLNRNFCTKNFQLSNFIKSDYTFITGRNTCVSESETQTIINTLDRFKFNKIISLHSVGGNFFIPDNSIDDKKIQDFGNQLKKILPNYLYNIDYNNLKEKENKIYLYEIDEGGSNKFTGTMESYIYEKYDIPIILIELLYHGKIEYKLKNLYTIF